MHDVAHDTAWELHAKYRSQRVPVGLLLQAPSHVYGMYMYICMHACISMLNNNKVIINIFLTTLDPILRLDYGFRAGDVTPFIWRTTCWPHIADWHLLTTLIVVARING